MLNLTKKLLLFLFLVAIGLSISPVISQAATLFLSPSSGSYKIGQTFTTTVYVSSSDQAMNAASFKIYFPNNLLKVISLSKSNSIISQWMPNEPGFSNTQGVIHGEGIVLNPGFKGGMGNLVTITFKTIGIGTANLKITEASVLANDGLGSQILSNAQGSNIQIVSITTQPVAPESETPSSSNATPTAPEVKSSTHPDPTQWYHSMEAIFTWSLPKGIIADRISINHNAHSRPTVLYSPAISSKKVLDLKEGIWYFHIQLKNKYGWGDITHFRVQIDRTPPKPFVLTIDNGGDSTNPQPLLHFHTQDILSGIDHYEVTVGKLVKKNLSPEDVKNGYYSLPVCPPGDYSVIVRAVDRAGNYSLAIGDVQISPIKAPIITSYSKQIYPGDPLVIKGTASKEGTIIVYVQNEKKEIVTSKSFVRDGHWQVILKKTLPRGIYQVWAELVDQRGAKSSLSHKYQVIVALPALLRVGGVVINYLSVINSLIAIILIMILVGFYGRRKIILMKRQINKETTEAEEALYKAFRHLERKTNREVGKLDGKTGLSPREKKIAANLKKALTESEKIIQKEIKDIEKRIKS